MTSFNNDVGNPPRPTIGGGQEHKPGQAPVTVDGNAGRPSGGETGAFTLEDLAAWKATVAETTPGEWMCWDGWGPDSFGTMNVPRIGPSGGGGLVASHFGSDIRGTRADFDFVAFAHNNLPELLLEIERLRFQLQRVYDLLHGEAPPSQSVEELLEQLEQAVPRG